MCACVFMCAVELTEYSKELRYFCQACPYVYKLEKKVNFVSWGDHGAHCTAWWEGCMKGRVCHRKQADGRDSYCLAHGAPKLLRSSC